MNDGTKLQLVKESIFVIGSVSSVSGRTVKIKVNKNKNSSHLLFDGDVLKNTSVNGYIKITKWFQNIIWKVEWEYIENKKVNSKDYNKDYNKEEDLIERFLEVSLFWSFNWDKFEQWIKEMPLIGNECYLLDKVEFTQLHKFEKKWEEVINIWKLSDEPSQDIEVSINQLFASHIGIFWNTGSWKSNTLAKIYYELFAKMEKDDWFMTRSKFIIIDFNWEYWKEKNDEIITGNKKVYNLNTRTDNLWDKIPLQEKDLIDLELISILSNATEKTQKPFIERALRLYKKINKKDDEEWKTIEEQVLSHFKNSLTSQLKEIFWLAVKDRAYTLLEYIKLLLDYPIDKNDDYDWSNSLDYFYSKDAGHSAWKITESQICMLDLVKSIESYTFPEDSISKFIHFLYLQIIYDIYNNKAQNDHVAPAINKLISRKNDIQRVFDTEGIGKIFDKGKNVVVINLKDTNTETKKTLPLLLAKKLYEDHKNTINFKYESLHLIIDEAHNILSAHSQRESESWKDYRLEVFEEIIKEGRKFNTFLTISSQRPHDISTTIISQLHNYFIHKLINDFDINAIHKTVAYLDKLSFESIPILPTWNCFFAWVSTNLPVKVAIDLLAKDNQPNSETVNLEDIWKLWKNDFAVEEKIDVREDDAASRTSNEEISVEDIPF